MTPRSLALLLPLLSLAPAALAQQTYVTRYDFFAGYANFNSPAINMSQSGMQMQFGMRPRTWYSMGFDYSISSGNLKITPDLLPPALQQTLGAQLVGLMKAGIIPTTYKLTVPASSTTHTFAAGPQLAYRHFEKITLFIRPSMGAIRETAVPKPTDAVASAIVKQLAPAGKKTDWQGFFGVGYGIDFLLSNHFAIRAQGDLVWDHLFNDILQNGRWTSRLSIGPAFNFGRNIAVPRR
jgi:hypothetical protein